VPNPPNILFLMSDEHRPDVTGYEGNPVVRTPVLDELARTGVVFRNAYCPSPICVPGRMAMMAGQLPRTCGCECYGQDLAPGAMTFARTFSQYAYQTVACGKLHHMGTDPLQGWNRLIGMHENLGPQHIAGRHEPSFERYAHGTVRNVKWSPVKEVLRAGIGRARPVVHDEYAVLGAHNYIEQYFVDACYDRATPDRPLLLKISLEEPHYPYSTHEDLFAYYLNRVEPFLDEAPFDHPFLSRHRVRVGEDVTERDLRRATAAYYGMVETVDRHYGSVMDALRHAGQDLDDWIILYTTDHGEMLGEHGVWEKQKFFEASARVPLIIRWPRGFDGGRTIDANVNQCDLFATLCTLAGIPTPEGLDSRSLVPFLRDEPVEWNNETVSQFGGTNLMIKRDALKYQYYGEDMPEVLFDLDADPGETRNFMHAPAYEAAIASFRLRRAELGFGPDADPAYVNAGY